MTTLSQRFNEKFETHIGVGCWLWTAYVDRHGYGRLRDGRRMISAHRLSYELARGAIPEGLELDHLCRTRHCVNPDHLEAVTHRENVRRGMTGEVSRTRQTMKTHCLNNHEYAGDNLIVRPNGWRMCRECHRAHVNKSYAKKRNLICKLT